MQAKAKSEIKLSIPLAKMPAFTSPGVMVGSWQQLLSMGSRRGALLFSVFQLMGQLYVSRDDLSFPAERHMLSFNLLLWSDSCCFLNALVSIAELPRLLYKQ